MEVWQYFGPLSAAAALVAQVVVLAVSWAKTAEGTKSAMSTAKDAKSIALEAHTKIEAQAAASALYREAALREFASKDTIAKMEERMVTAIESLTDRIDRALERRP